MKVSTLKRLLNKEGRDFTISFNTNLKDSSEAPRDVINRFLRLGVLTEEDLKEARSIEESSDFQKVKDIFEGVKCAISRFKEIDVEAVKNDPIVRKLTEEFEEISTKTTEKFNECWDRAEKTTSEFKTAVVQKREELEKEWQEKEEKLANSSKGQMLAYFIEQLPKMDFVKKEGIFSVNGAMYHTAWEDKHKNITVLYTNNLVNVCKDVIKDALKNQDKEYSFNNDVIVSFNENEVAQCQMKAIREFFTNKSKEEAKAKELKELEDFKKWF